MKKISIVFIILIFIFTPFLTKADLTTDYNTQYNALQQQILNLQNEEKQAIQGITNQAIPISAMTGQANTIIGKYDNQIQQVKSQEQQLYLNYQEALNNQQSCPANASCSNGQFFCNSGYVVSGQSCITYNQSCQNQYGINSYGDKNNCYCNAGYQWNSSKTGCEVIACPNNSSLVGSQCFCNNGYIQSGSVCITYTQDCINSFGNNVYGIKGNNNNSSCNCDTGYQWNSQQTACIIIPPSAVNNPAPVFSEKINTAPTPKIQKENSKQQNPIQNKIADSKSAGTNPSSPAPSFLSKIYNSVKNFFNNMFK